MAKYYATIAGLPNLGVEDRKLPFSSSFFVEELQKELKKKDKLLLDTLCLADENKFVIRFLEAEEEARQSKEQPTLFSYNDLSLILEKIKSREPLPKRKILPKYIIDFLKETQIEATEEELEIKKNKEDYSDDETRRKGYPIRLEDKLAEYYYKYAINSSNYFVSMWSKFNCSLRNILVAYVSKELQWNVADYIVGDSPLERKLKTSSSANFGLEEDDVQEISKIGAIVAEKDITRRERLLDQLRWSWLEESTFDKIFDIEAILCYYLKLRIVERWTELNEEKGEETFRNIVASLKKESNESLEEFKRNQKKQ